MTEREDTGLSETISTERMFTEVDQTKREKGLKSILECMVEKKKSIDRMDKNSRYEDG